MARSPRPLAVAALVLAATLLPAALAWQERFPDTRDYASFHYAVRVWLGGGDPWDGALLSAAARAEGTRQAVYPFLYPPPALALLAWTAPLALSAGYAAMYWLNVGALLALLAALRRWLGAPAWLLALLGLTWTPATWSGRLGQVNAVLALLVVLALWRGRGTVLALAAVVKLSPALLAAPWLVRGRWRPLLGLAIAAALAHLLIAPWVPPATQLHYYRDVLPGLASGGWNGLDVPVSLPANHSLANLADQRWPGPTPTSLSPAATWASRAAVAALLLPLLALARRPRDRVGEGALAGALLALMVLAPVYTWEHHLVFLVPAMAAAVTAWTRGRLPRWTAALLALAWLALALPIEELRASQRGPAAVAWLAREGKTGGALLLGALCAWAAARSPAAPR